ncbi:hypothetical protein EVAR_67079_1 [Eumeta japonica]|uniref:Uncharacterized protein n=1 Tax=Eumeta variegata TaxID=151549 RepID=A0A4C2A3W4_EUMVA|nr:hypothetical protein EVAR_67079_1 [Eumeta japonica]
MPSKLEVSASSAKPLNPDSDLEPNLSTLAQLDSNVANERCHCWNRRLHMFSGIDACGLTRLKLKTYRLIRPRVSLLFPEYSTTSDDINTKLKTFAQSLEKARTDYSKIRMMHFLLGQISYSYPRGQQHTANPSEIESMHGQRNQTGLEQIRSEVRSEVHYNQCGSDHGNRDVIAITKYIKENGAGVKISKE